MTDRLRLEVTMVPQESLAHLPESQIPASQTNSTVSSRLTGLTPLFLPPESESLLPLAPRVFAR